MQRKLLTLVWVGLCGVGLAQPPVVTEIKKVSNWEQKGQAPQIVRKINERWWSIDDREVSPPTKDRSFWVREGEPGEMTFEHHRPFDPAKEDSLHLFMKPAEVRAILGEPNAICGKEPQAIWFYYAADGTKLTLRFLDDGVLAEGSNDTIGRGIWPVASLEKELDGRKIEALLEERATKRMIDAHPARPFAVRQPGQ